jgi:GH25 family lysozyme M1 (1,4-beta-N-acetylmuramidase)
MNANGCDASKYQAPVNAQLGYERGLRFVFLRATVGDYYTDPSLRDSWQKYKDAGFLVSAYLVTAPREPACTRQITAQAHLDLFFNAVAGLQPDFAWVVDAELARNETNKYITKLHKDVVTGLYNSQSKFPLIYTRESWWDYCVSVDPLWSQCDLFPARYGNYLTSPWSDGLYKFRDSHADGKYFGFSSLDGDLDWFNGDEAKLCAYAGKPQPLSRLDVLEREARKAGWNLTP